MGENGCSRNVVEDGGYKKKHPPHDDCCPICFDSFKFPCRTNCGHWYCGGCFLQLWRHTEDVKWCKCPMCQCVVKKLIPYSSKLIPQEDGQKILKDIRQYNHQNVRRWFAFSLGVLKVLPMLPPEYPDRMMLLTIIYSQFLILLLQTLANLLFRFGFMPSWLWEIMLFIYLFLFAVWSLLVMFFMCDSMWFRRGCRARRLAHAL